MGKKEPVSLQDILRGRQHEEFVGREEQLAFFRANLGYGLDDRRRRFIINVSGPGGVGKTWLLRRFRKIAEEAGIITADTDETQEDVPSVLGHLAEQFEAHKHPLKSFARRYKVYRQRRQELEADPEVPRGLPAFLARTLVKGGFDLLRLTPGGSVASSLVDTEAAASLAGDFASFVAEKIGNKDEVRLVLEPIDALTPLFLADLRDIAERAPLALFIDTYERTGDFLDAWLCDLLEGRYGTVPAEITLVIAGRGYLDHNRWAPYEGLVARLSLKPFTEDEARGYLARKGIHSEQVTKVILRLSGQLPLLVATLAAESPDDPDKVGGLSGEAVERFLKWVDDPNYRRVAQDAALPRLLNRDILAVLEGEEEVETLFAWLSKLPFVGERGYGWVYHPVVREQLLRHKHRKSPIGWADLHKKLAEYYEEQRKGLGLSDESGPKDPLWRKYSQEATYHRLCQAPQAFLADAIDLYMEALEAQRTHALRPLVRTVSEALEDADASPWQQYGRKMVEMSDDYKEGRYLEAIESLTFFLGQMERIASLLDRTELADQWCAALLIGRGAVYNRIGQREEALADFDQAIVMVPDHPWAMAGQAETYLKMGRHREASMAFDRLMESDARMDWIYVRRGIALRQVGRYDEALEWIDKGLRLDPYDARNNGHRGITLRVMDRYDQALIAFDQAIGLDSELDWLFAQKGITLQEMERYEEALEWIDKAVAVDPKDAWNHGPRGVTLRLMGRYDEALKAFDTAIELNSEADWFYVQRGITLRETGRYEEALEWIDRGVTIDPKSAWNNGERGIVLRLLERHNEALEAFDTAIELNPEADWIYGEKGIALREIGRFEEALIGFDRAIELDPEYAWAIAERGLTYRLMEQHEEALADFDRAIGLDPDDWFFYHRALLHQIRGKSGRARADFAMAIDRAQQAYEEIPEPWRNSLHLGLYRLAAGDVNYADSLYREALDGGVPSGNIREAIKDLDDLLDLVPDAPHAVAMRELLQDHLLGRGT